MIFKFIRRHLTRTINRIFVREGRILGKNSTCTIITNKTFDENMLLNSSWSLTVSSITFILYNNLTLNVNQQINQSINTQRKKTI